MQTQQNTIRQKELVAKLQIQEAQSESARFRKHWVSNPKEALYVFYGILEKNTIPKIREHTTNTHGYTEINFALCYLLGYYFMSRIKYLNEQQLYSIDRTVNYRVFTPLLNKK